MPVQPTYRPHHLALAIALALGCVGPSHAEDQATTPPVEIDGQPKVELKGDPLHRLLTFIGASDTALHVIDSPQSVVKGGKGNDLFIVKNGGSFNGRAEGGGGTNVIHLDASDGGTLGDTRNFAGLYQSQGAWTLASKNDFKEGVVVLNEGVLTNEGKILGDAITLGQLFNKGEIRGHVEVEEGGTFAGAGTIGSLNVRGNLEVSSLHGAPKVRGNLSLSDSAVLAYGVAPDGSAGTIRVGGTASLGDATLKIVAVPGDYSQTGQHTVIEAKKVEGQFGKVLHDLAFMEPVVQYDQRKVGLTYARNEVSIADIATTESGKAIGASIIEPPTIPHIQTPTEGAPGAIGEKVTDASAAAPEPTDATTPTAALPPTSNATSTAAATQQTTTTTNTAVNALLTSDKATAAYALEILAGDSNAHLARATLNSDAPITATLLSAMRQLDTAGFFDNPNRAPRFAAGNGDNGRVWLQALGHSGKLDRDYDPLQHSTQGLVLGADWRIDEHWRLGVMGGQSRTRQKSRELEGDLDSWHVGAYALRQDGPMSIRLGATHNSHDGSSARRVEFHGFKDRPKGRYDASTQQAFAEVGYNLGRASFSVEPFASVGYQRYQRDGFSEKGGDAALKVHGQSEENFSSTFGLRLAKLSTFDNGMQLVPRVSAGWKHAYGEVYTETRQRLVKGGNDYSVYSAPLDRNTLMVDAGMDLKLSKRNTLGIALTGEMGSDSRSHGVTGQWRMSF
ncbi:autotransporter outer membrane beta-barrel domain-containing protein [Pseudomonas sp. 14P_8.1_Bac3]|uniref:autotransporter outer membrane beta-barrel domain-containing protein n=1 Tax=Pseudomonas sp. 14P_8.1_Bac3 TaxID=2971621 RepID=UPI0021CA06EC|nr:autotransporter outer membrane beta-barrel domain-containing protein [Pseudomonas sp. 14P_8.1_Bac3]MCU1762777.1 autotransporter outer membrane beta-barrel domain-containing protein [Pseudomonas sp. 14P_8.1_Bac3]